MKRLISIMLLAAVCLGLVACGEDEPAANTTAGTTAAQTEATTQATTEALETLGSVDSFSVGYARVDITPQIPVPMAGFGRSSERMSRNILDNLYATAIAIADGQGNTVILMSMDLQRCSDITVNTVRPLISAKTGIPEDHIMMCGTHTHSGPDLNATSHPAIIQYIDYLNPRLLQTAVEALADLKPAQMYVGSTETDSLNFVRHYAYTTEDGTTEYFGDNFGTETLDATTVHTTDVDPTMHLVKFTREGQKDIIMANWRAHATMTGGRTKYDVSADYVGSFRFAMENQLDCRFIYFNGAAGNVNCKSRIPGEKRATDCQEQGYLMSQHAMEGLANMQQVETGPIRTQQVVLDLEVNHDTDALYYKAKEVASYWNQSGDMEGSKEMGAPFGIRSPYHAQSILSRYSKAETMDVELNAIAIGDHFALTTAPNELFDTLTEYMEENSPYQMTMFFGYANGMRGYIPSAYGWEYTCYESDCCNFKPGSGEFIRDTMLEMLGKTAEE